MERRRPAELKFLGLIVTIDSPVYCEMATGPQKVSHLPPPRDHAGSTNSPARPISSSPPALRANGSMKPAGGACWGHPLRGMLGACWGHPLCQNGQKWVVPSGPYRSLTRRRPSNPRRVFQINDYFVIPETPRPRYALIRETNNSEFSSMPLDPRQVKALFDAVIELPDPVGRLAFLDQECRDEPELRRRLDDLLAAYVQPASVLARPSRSTSSKQPPPSKGRFPGRRPPPS